MQSERKAYLVGGGIASLSAAVYLIKDGKLDGGSITIFEESSRIGGSLDARNLSSSEGYSMRGIRMFEEKAYYCLFDLMSVIPSLNAPEKTLRQEFIDYNKENKTYSKARLLKNGIAVDGRPLKLSFKDRKKLLMLAFKRESTIEDVQVRDYFTSSFFTSNFWYEFCTVFAFQPWHSLIEFRRYFFRFIQSFSNIDTLESIESSPYNQYEFLVLPIMEWLKARGVSFVPNTKVIDIEFVDRPKGRVASVLHCKKDTVAEKIAVQENDLVFVTLGSLVANSSSGSMNSAPQSNLAVKDASWAALGSYRKRTAGIREPFSF